LRDAAGVIGVIMLQEMLTTNVTLTDYWRPRRIKAVERSQKLQEQYILEEFFLFIKRTAKNPPIDFVDYLLAEND
jgi:hypothetical protein